MNKIKLTIILTLFAALCTAAYRQVTVGSGNKPVNGALLDIKEKDEATGGVTATKGLLMPRVNLSKKDQLYPMFESTTTPGTDNDDYNDGTKKSDQNKKHTGLVVYNVTPVPTEGLDVGVHSWDGTKWVAVKNGSGSGTTYSSDYPIVVKNDNIYLATTEENSSTPLATGSILRFDGADWVVVVPVDNDTQYTGSASIAVDASTHVISVENKGVTTSKIDDVAVTTAKIADANVTPVKIAGSTTAGEVLTSNGTGSAPSWTAIPSQLPTNATAGQVLKWNGSKWVADTDANTTYTASSSILISGANNTLTRAALTGDVTALAGDNATTITNGAVTTAKLADNSVNSAKIIDGSITGADILNTTIPATKLIGGGTVGYVLTVTTANAAPTWEPAAAPLPSIPDNAGGTWTISANSGCTCAYVATASKVKHSSGSALTWWTYRTGSTYVGEDWEYPLALLNGGNARMDVQPGIDTVTRSSPAIAFCVIPGAADVKITIPSNTGIYVWNP
jgi:hypothetical protein